MTMTIAILIIIAAMAAYFFFSRRKEEDQPWHATTFSKAERIWSTREPALISEAGYKIYYEDGLEPLPFHPEAVDRGIGDVFRRLECAYGERVGVHRHTDVKVIVLPGEPSADGSPAFRVAISPGNPYHNSDWDKMKGSPEKIHYILAAGETVAAGTPYGDVIVIPYCTEEYKDYMAMACGHEWEHIGLAWYDGERYEATKHHQTEGHPLIPECS